MYGRTVASEHQLVRSGTVHTSRRCGSHHFPRYLPSVQPAKPIWHYDADETDTHNLSSHLVPELHADDLEIIHRLQRFNRLHDLLPILILPKASGSIGLLDDLITVMMSIPHEFTFVVDECELLVLVSKDVMGSLGDILEMQEFAFMMFRPGWEGSRGGGMIGGEVIECHCERVIR